MGGEPDPTPGKPRNCVWGSDHTPGSRKKSQGVSPPPAQFDVSVGFMQVEYLRGIFLYCR